MDKNLGVYGVMHRMPRIPSSAFEIKTDFALLSAAEEADLKHGTASWATAFAAKNLHFSFGSAAKAWVDDKVKSVTGRKADKEEAFKYSSALSSNKLSFENIQENEETSLRLTLLLLITLCYTIFY